MGLPAFATVEDLAARIPGGVEVKDYTRAQAALDDASAKIRAETGESWVTGDALDIPSDPDWAADRVQSITIAVARRAFENPEGLAQQSEGLGAYNHSEQFTDSSSDIYLTAAEKSDLAKITGGTGGVWTLATTRSESDRPDLRVFAGDVYLGVEDSEMIPFLPIDAGNGL